MKEIDPVMESKILKLIKARIGKSNPIQVKDIMEFVALPDREIRRIVQHLINIKGYAIGSTTKDPHGFFMIVSLDDYLEAIKNLMGRKEKIHERIEALKKACRKNGLEVPEVKIHETQGQTNFYIKNSIVINLK
ncbi:MAG: hypothetical protein N3A71_01950 [Candidatus Dojkabacteria bacterium]|nr:hypothetical protein [Candidatus Dojkabacteria bacterium]